VELSSSVLSAILQVLSHVFISRLHWAVEVPVRSFVGKQQVETLCTFNATNSSHYVDQWFGMEDLEPFR